MIKVIVFDFDGVIVDSSRMKYDTWFDFFSGKNERLHRITCKLIPTLQHESRFNVFRAILKEAGTAPHAMEPLVARYANERSRMLREKIIEKGFLPKAKETIAQYAGRYALYINSGTPEEELLYLTQKLGLVPYFKSILGRRDFGDESILESKKKNFAKIFEKENVLPQEMLMVGDSETDCRASAGAGCAFIGVANELNGWEDKKMPFPVITSIADMGPLIPKKLD